MAIVMPNVEVVFKQLATSLIERSERGIAVLVVRDDTNKTFSIKEYSSLSVVDESHYTSDNMQAIKDVFAYALNKVYVARVNVGESNINGALALIEKTVKTAWISVKGEKKDSEALASWIKSQELKGKTYKAVVHKVTAPDCKHIVNFFNDNVTYADERGLKSGDEYLPSLLGILASCNIKRGATYYKCANLKSVVEVADNNDAVNSGKLVLINDSDGVKIANAVNSMTTVNGSTQTEDMKYVDTVEAMDIIADDISATFKREYMGSYRNSYDNQVLLIGSIGEYLKGLAEVDILDKNYSNNVGIDIEAQRSAWIGVGTAEAVEWSEQKVKEMAFKRTVFLKGDIKILGSMDNLKFKIALA